MRSACACQRPVVGPSRNTMAPRPERQCHYVPLFVLFSCSIGGHSARSLPLSLCESHNHGHARTLTDHGLDATNVGWPYDGLTPSRAPLHSLAFAEESCGEQVDCAHCAVRATHERREQRECRSFKNVHDEEPGERYERGQVSPANEPRTYSYVAELVVWARWLLQCFRSNTGRARALREAAGTVRSAHLAVCTDDSQ